MHKGSLVTRRLLGQSQIFTQKPETQGRRARPQLSHLAFELVVLLVIRISQKQAAAPLN